ncbi:MAG: iron chelate uptake ABC transporter family permease subunit [Pseudomonadota bacterium]
MLFMTLGARGNWDFVLPYRGAKLLALLLVASAIATSTLLFQTITRNRILTPSIMGFDALYLLMLTAAVFLLGAGGYGQIPEPAQFLITLALLIAGALTLYGTLLNQIRQDLMRMILTGVIIGVLFRSLNAFMSRMIDPNEFSVIQINSYARFNRIETDLLSIALLLCGTTLIVAWRMRHRLDVLALGHNAAINLGEDPRRTQLQILILISVLVATSIALVGPVAFLGLLVVNVAYLITPSPRHATLLPSAVLIGAIVLIGGQMILEHSLGLSTPLAVVIDLAGGIVFLTLILKGTVR